MRVHFSRLGAGFVEKELHDLGMRLIARVDERRPPELVADLELANRPRLSDARGSPHVGCNKPICVITCVHRVSCVSHVCAMCRVVSCRVWCTFGC